MKKIRLLSVTLAIVLLDQVTKHLARLYLQTPVQMIPGILTLILTSNTGASFGILKGYNTLFIVISIAVLVYLFRFFKERKTYFLQICIIAGGILGNLIDRVWQGFVTDFIWVNYFSIFNLADAAISIGVAWMILKSWKRHD